MYNIIVHRMSYIIITVLLVLLVPLVSAVPSFNRVPGFPRFLWFSWFLWYICMHFPRSTEFLGSLGSLGSSGSYLQFLHSTEFLGSQGSIGSLGSSDICSSFVPKSSSVPKVLLVPSVSHFPQSSSVPKVPLVLLVPLVSAVPSFHRCIYDDNCVYSFVIVCNSYTMQCLKLVDRKNVLLILVHLAMALVNIVTHHVNVIAMDQTLLMCWRATIVKRLLMLIWHCRSDHNPVNSICVSEDSESVNANSMDVTDLTDVNNSPKTQSGVGVSEDIDSVLKDSNKPDKSVIVPEGNNTVDMALPVSDHNPVNCIGVSEDSESVNANSMDVTELTDVNNSPKTKSGVGVSENIDSVPKDSNKSESVDWSVDSTKKSDTSHVSQRQLGRRLIISLNNDTCRGDSPYCFIPNEPTTLVV